MPMRLPVNLALPVLGTAEAGAGWPPNQAEIPEELNWLGPLFQAPNDTYSKPSPVESAPLPGRGVGDGAAGLLERRGAPGGANIPNASNVSADGMLPWFEAFIAASMAARWVGTH